jgi:hypothetical protein
MGPDAVLGRVVNHEVHEDQVVNHEGHEDRS